VAATLPGVQRNAPIGDDHDGLVNRGEVLHGRTTKNQNISERAGAKDA
jgi:hypothetical protein